MVKFDEARAEMRETLRLMETTGSSKRRYQLWRRYLQLEKEYKEAVNNYRKAGREVNE